MTWFEDAGGRARHNSASATPWARAAGRAVARARAGGGPALLEAKTYRYYNHHGIQNLGLKYRPDDEVLAWKERELGTAEIADASPVPEGAALLGRFLALVALIMVSAAGTEAFAQQVPTPASHFGFEIGTDRRLADWDQLVAFYEKLARASDHSSGATGSPVSVQNPR